MQALTYSNTLSYEDTGTNTSILVSPNTKKLNLSFNDFLSTFSYEYSIKELIRTIYNKVADNKLEFSKNTEDEIVLFKNVKKNTWVNLIIDEDGDVELLVIPNNRKNTFNEYFFIEDEDTYSVDKIVQRFNELCR